MKADAGKKSWNKVSLLSFVSLICCQDSGAEADPSQLFSAGPSPNDDEEEQLFPCTQPPTAPVPGDASSTESSGDDSDGEVVDETTVSYRCHMLFALV